MPRRLPRFDSDLRIEVTRTLDLIDQFEAAKARQATTVPVKITQRSIDYVYELAYLNVFKGWENFLEECFVRCLCGYENRNGSPVFLPGKLKKSNTVAATAEMLNGRDYLLWHNADVVVKRCRLYFSSCDTDTVLSSNLADLNYYANVRHRIAHGQLDSKVKFDASTMALTGRRYRLSSAGAFLRDWVPGVAPPTRWMHEIASNLHSLAVQISS